MKHIGKKSGRIDSFEGEQSSEEKFIVNYFSSNKIKYESEKIIPKLYGDQKSFRRADFYLPRLRLYVEYFGQYNSTKQRRNEYDKKAKIYFKNHIPTVILYPHELGIIDYAFNWKAVKVLKMRKFNLRRQLFRYRLNRFWKKVGGSIFAILYTSGVFIYTIEEMNTGLSEEFSAVIIFIFFLIFMMALIHLFQLVHKYFWLDK